MNKISKDIIVRFKVNVWFLCSLRSWVGIRMVFQLSKCWQKQGVKRKEMDFVLST